MGKEDKIRINRRTFIKMGAVGAAAAAVGSSRGTPLARAANEAGKRRVLALGAGGAGLAAAVQASDTGAQVTVVEREASPGGNTGVNTGLFRGSETWVQEKLGIKDSKQEDFNELWENGDRLAEPELLGRLVENSSEAVQWLKDLGVPFEDKMGIYPRTALVKGGGRVAMEQLYKVARQKGVNFDRETRATDLILTEGKVTGAIAVRAGRELTYKGYDAVILCTGGAWGPKEYLEPLTKGTIFEGVILQWGVPTGGKADGFKMAEKVGGWLEGPTNLGTNPSLILDRNYKGLGDVTSSLRHTGGAIFLNQALERFANEDLTYNILAEEVAKELQKRKENWIWEVFDSQAMELVPISREYPRKYASALYKGESIASLAQAMGVNEEKLARALTKYRSYFETKLEKDHEFGRPLRRVPSLSKPPFYAFKIGILINQTRAGLKIDTQARVLDRQGRAIPNLFAAGDEAGGLFGKGYMTGAAFLRTVVFGRVAGENAASGRLGAAEDQGYLHPDKSA